MVRAWVNARKDSLSFRSWPMPRISSVTSSSADCFCASLMRAWAYISPMDSTWNSFSATSRFLLLVLPGHFCERLFHQPLLVVGGDVALQDLAGNGRAQFRGVRVNLRYRLLFGGIDFPQRAILKC